MALDPKLLEILACPVCHGRIREREGGSRLQCLECGLQYPVLDGIPILLADRAESPDPEET